MRWRQALGKGLRSRGFVVGAVLFAVGALPLLTVLVLAELGLTADPNPNPVGFGILYTFVGQAGLLLMALALARAVAEERSARRRGTPPTGRTS